MSIWCTVSSHRRKVHPWVLLARNARSRRGGARWQIKTLLWDAICSVIRAEPAMGQASVIPVDHGSNLYCSPDSLSLGSHIQLSCSIPFRIVLPFPFCHFRWTWPQPSPSFISHALRHLIITQHFEPSLVNSSTVNIPTCHKHRRHMLLHPMLLTLRIQSWVTTNQNTLEPVLWHKRMYNSISVSLSL